MILRSIRHPDNIPRKIDRTLNYQISVWLDDIIIVTRGDKEKHREKLFTMLEKLLEARYGASEK